MRTSLTGLTGPAPGELSTSRQLPAALLCMCHLRDSASTPALRHLKHADFLGRKAEVKKLESGNWPPRSRADTARARCPTHI